MVTARGEDTRKQIVDEALAMTSQFGITNITIGGLAKATGMSKSGLFAHFNSKEELQVQVIEVAVARFVRHVVRPALTEPRGLPRVRALFDQWLAWTRASFLPGGCVFQSMANELDDVPGPARERLVASQRDWYGTLERAAAIAVEEGHFRADLDPAFFAFEEVSIMLAYHQYRRLIRHPHSADYARQSFESLLARASA